MTQNYIKLFVRGLSVGSNQNSHDPTVLCHVTGPHSINENSRQISLI
jgi:hypothetical protein